MGFRLLLKPALTTLFFTAPTNLAIAADVELKSPDGLFGVEGTITEFDGTMYTLKSSVGTVRVPVADVLCYGAGCPEGAPRGVDDVTVAIAYDDAADRALLEMMLKAENPESGLDITTSESEMPQIAETRSDKRVSLNVEPYDSEMPNDLRISSTNSYLVATPARVTTAMWANPEGAGTQLMSLKAMAAITSKGIGISDISMTQLAQIYSGRITNWSEIGGANQRINALQLPKDTLQNIDFVTTVLTPNGLKMSPSVLTVNTESQAREMVEKIPGAIAVLGLEAAKDATPLSIVNQCGQAVAPNEFEIKIGRYPLVQATLAETQRPDMQSVVSKFFDSAALPAVQNVTRESGYIDHTVTREAASSKSERVAQMMKMEMNDAEKEAARDLFGKVIDAQRLSIGFSDGDVSPTHGALYRADFVRLSHAIEAGEFDNQDIMFFGFTQGASGSAEAISMSQKAAENMLKAFETFAPEAASRASVTLTASGFGALSPNMCDALENEKTNTNHVEVWTRPSTL